MLSHWPEHMEIATHRSTNMAAVTNSWLAVRNFTPQTNRLSSPAPPSAEHTKHCAANCEMKETEASERNAGDLFAIKIWCEFGEDL